MGDSTAMTIEFLRARLLSERSVSRTARQRSDQLAKRVMELEEQIRIVTIQRKTAEKAAAEVLAILESQGIGDSSEAIDSSSDQDEASSGMRRKEDSLKEEENSMGSRMERSEVEDRLSGSELDVSSLQGKSLSWKSRGSNLDSCGKEKVKQVKQRHRRSMFTVESSPKHHLGKSCRRIRQRETRSAAEDEANTPVLLDAHENGGATLSGCSDYQSDIPRDASKNEKEVSMNTLVTCSLDDPRKGTSLDLYDNGSDRDEEMERALQQQAQLIGQYQAEENAQRAWEEKYNENHSSSLVLSRIGNEPAVAENPTDSKEEAMERTGDIPYSEEVKLRTGPLSNLEEPTAQGPTASVPSDQKLHCKNQEDCSRSKEAIGLSKGIAPTDLAAVQDRSSYHLCSDGLFDQQFDRSVKGMESSSHELVVSVKEGPGRTTNGKQNQRCFLDTSDTCFHSKESLPLHVDGYLQSPHMDSPSSMHFSGRNSKWRSSDLQSQLHGQLPQASSKSLGSALEALRRAKVSLQRELNRPPSSEGTLAIAASTDPQIQGTDYDNMLGIPIGSAGLFRLPTDSFAQTNLSGPKLDALELRFSAIRPDLDYPMGGNGYQYPTTQYMEAVPRVTVGKQYVDPFITSEIGIPASSTYSLPPSSMVPKRTPSRDGFSSPYLEVRNGMPIGQRYLYSGHGTWPDLWRL